MYDWEYKGGKINDFSFDGFWNVEMYCDVQGVWCMGVVSGMQRGYDVFNFDGRVDYFCYLWNYEIKVGDKGFFLDVVWVESLYMFNEVGSMFFI